MHVNKVSHRDETSGVVRRCFHRKQEARVGAGSEKRKAEGRDAAENAEGRDAHVVTHQRDVARLTKDVIRTINVKVGPKRSLVNEQGGDELPEGR